MANAVVRASRRGRLLAWSAGLLAVCGVLAGRGPSSLAKDPPKAAPAKAAPKVIDIFTGPSGFEQISAINQEIEKKWQENKITPSARCTDYEFIRRASLDIIGRIARPEEIRQFMKDPAQKRRSMLIERLLTSDEYAKNWANIWKVWLLTRSGALAPTTQIYHEQMQVWLEEQFAKDEVGFDQMVTELVSATGKTNDNQAVNFILAHLGEPIKDDPRTNGKWEMVPITSRTTRLFLGLRTQCTQCHDHPFNDEWKQSHFWGINAFFRQTDAPKGRPMGMRIRMATDRVLELVDDPSLNPEGIVFYERRNGVILPTGPVFLDGKKMPPLQEGSTRRKELAKFIVKSDYFAKAYVNRMWGHFLGRGFTKTVDDFGEHNPISHPELLDRLAQDFAKKYGHNPRHLIRWICNSEAYGLSSAANNTNDKEDAEPFFGRMLLKAMSPEQLFESLMVATQSKAAQTAQNKKKLRQDWMSKLVVNFGNDEGEEITFNGTVVQALLLMNGPEINAAITDQNTGTVAAVLKRATSRSKAMEELFMAALNRPPTTKEYSRLLSPSVGGLHRGAKDTAAGFYQDMFWALLNSNEFILNH
jgi:hypothetical protein